MTFGGEKRLLLAALAALAPLPLPFNEILSWPLLLLFWGVIGLFVSRSSSGCQALPEWAMNVLGALYLPVLVADFTVLWRGHLMQPLVHLALFTLVAKLYGMTEERDKWHIFLLAFFVFVASMGTSVHPAVSLYLLAYVGASLFLLNRFASYHVLASYGVELAGRRDLPMGRFVGAVTGYSALIAIPIFIVLPRLGTPYVVAPFLSSGGAVQQAGFGDEFTLDVIGRVRTSRAVAMRLAYETPPPPAHEMRYKVASYTLFRGASWFKDPEAGEPLSRSLDGFFHVTEKDPKSWVEVWLQPPRGDTLALPTEAAAVDIDLPRIRWDSLGVASLLMSPPGTLSYRVGMASQRDPGLVAGALPEPGGPPRAAGEVSRAILELAREAAGEGSAGQQVRQIERYLMREYEYTLDLVGRESSNPVEDFLFSWRKGHCEYFATSMVLMLRSIGIPARLVTGFLGGEYNPLEGYYIVRQSNAHAWVEAYLPDEGWRIFDPTPASGRPDIRPSNWGDLLSQAYDFVVFRWDRHVLTFGFSDQVGVIRRLLVLWRDLWKAWRPKSSPVVPGISEEAPARESPNLPEELPSFGQEWWWIPLGIVFLIVAGWLWWHRPPLDATRAFKRLRAMAVAQAGLPNGEATAPLEVRELVVNRWPKAAGPTQDVIELYLRESFGGHELQESEREALRADLRTTLTEMRKASWGVPGTSGVGEGLGKLYRVSR